MKALPRPGHEWSEPERVARYRASAATIPRWRESEVALVEHLPARVDRVLDLGTGDGRLIDLVRRARPGIAAVGIDRSAPMLGAAQARFAAAPEIELVVHDLGDPLPPMGGFDLVVSGFAIHHLEDARKRALYGEVLEVLTPGGRFLNLEHVASASPRIHAEFLAAIGEGPGDQDPSDRLVPAWTQVRWLAELGYEDADCLWKWRELALLGGRRPAA
jgi:SAM-dependent methyltransferase